MGGGLSKSKVKNETNNQKPHTSTTLISPSSSIQSLPPLKPKLINAVQHDRKSYFIPKTGTSLVQYGVQSAAVSAASGYPPLFTASSSYEPPSLLNDWLGNNKGVSLPFRNLHLERLDQNASRIKNIEENLHLNRLKQISGQYDLGDDIQGSKQKCNTLNSVISLNPRLEAQRQSDLKYFSLIERKPELTPHMMQIIENACIPFPPSEILSQIGDIEILRKDIQTLTHLNWLNDEIINAYMSLLVARGDQPNFNSVYAFNTFFYPKVRESGYNSVRRWTRKVDIFRYSLILVPVHLGNHWCLALIDLEQKIISYYDSLGGRQNGACDTLLGYLRDESSDKRKTKFDDNDWQLIDMAQENIPQQTNYSDCGVFACTYALYLSARKKLTFGQEDMPYFRKRMVYEIISKRILT